MFNINTLPVSPQLCFAYSGGLKREVGVKFSYKNSEGATKTATAQVPLPADQDSGYACIRGLELRYSSDIRDVIDGPLLNEATVVQEVEIVV